MSWDFSMKIDVGGAELLELADYELNYTYNVSPMYFRAFKPELDGGVRGLHEMTGRDAAPHLERAIQRMVDGPREYIAMNPSSGWGDYDGALKALHTLHEWCREAPKAMLWVG